MHSSFRLCLLPWPVLSLCLCVSVSHFLFVSVSLCRALFFVVPYSLSLSFVLKCLLLSMTCKNLSKEKELIHLARGKETKSQIHQSNTAVKHTFHVSLLTSHFSLLTSHGEEAKDTLSIQAKHTRRDQIEAMQCKTSQDNTSHQNTRPDNT
jgi:hypothetical protein